MVLEQYGSESGHDKRLDRTFAALADPTRRALLARLSRGEASVAELAAPFAVSPRAVSKHLSVLERAGLIERRRDAQRRPSTLRMATLDEADAWMRKFREHWNERFAAMDDLLATDTSSQ